MDLHYEYLRDLERIEMYDNNDPDTQIFFWQATARIAVYRELLSYAETKELDNIWKTDYKTVPMGLRWNRLTCTTLREPKECESTCYSCCNYLEDPEVSQCAMFGLTYGMDDDDYSDFSIYTCDEYRENE